MKKLLGIVVLGLLLSGNAYAAKRVCIAIHNNYLEVDRPVLIAKRKMLIDAVGCQNGNELDNINQYKIYGFKTKDSITKKLFPKVRGDGTNNNWDRWTLEKLESSLGKADYEYFNLPTLQERKLIAEKPKKQEPEKLDTHKILLDNKIVVLYEGEKWELQFLKNNKIISQWRGESNYKFTWHKMNNNGLYEIKFPGTKSQYWDINIKDQNFIVRGSDNSTTSHSILSPKYENLIAEKPKKQEPKKKTPDPDDNKIVAASSGTGFYVSNTGHIISNHHVVEGCNTVKLTFKGKEVTADVLAVDKMNDLAILKADLIPSKVYSVATEDASLLEDIIIAGYPLGKKVSAAIKTSKGSITALAGDGDNYSEFQTDAALNKGNSGGPIMNQKGNVVGLAVADYGKQAGVESFNFGIKSSTLKTFANANGLKFLPPNNKDLSNKDLGQLITEATIYLECHMTVAKIKRMIAEAENKKAFFSEYR